MASYKCASKNRKVQRQSGQQWCRGKSSYTVWEIFSPSSYFFWDLITALSYWDMFYPSTCPRGCWKIFAVCAHIRHIWAWIWKTFFEKTPNFDRNFCMCRLSANKFSKYISLKGLYMKELSCQIFCLHMELRCRLSFMKDDCPGFSRFLIFCQIWSKFSK